MQMNKVIALGLGLVMAAGAVEGSSQKIHDKHAQTASDAPIVFRLEPYAGTTLALRGEMNGHSGLFLFDTGGGVSVIDSAFEKTIRCEPWGRITGFRMTGERLDMPKCDHVLFVTSGVDFLRRTVGVLDLSALLPPNAPHLDGSVGLDMFTGSKITFNQAEHVLIVENQKSFSERTLRAHEVPMMIVRDAGGFALTVKIGVPTSKGLAWMELDSGNEGPVAIADYIAPLLKTDSDSTSTSLKRFNVASGIPVDGPIKTENLIMDGNLGTSFLQKWIVSLDLSEGRAWLSPSSGYTP